MGAREGGYPYYEIYMTSKIRFEYGYEREKLERVQASHTVSLLI